MAKISAAKLYENKELSAVTRLGTSRSDFVILKVVGIFLI